MEFGGADNRSKSVTSSTDWAPPSLTSYLPLLHDTTTTTTIATTKALQEENDHGGPSCHDLPPKNMVASFQFTNPH